MEVRPNSQSFPSFFPVGSGDRPQVIRLASKVPLPAEPPTGQRSFLLFEQYLLSTFSRLQVTSAYQQLATLDQFCVKEPSPRYETRLGPPDPGAQAPACWSLLSF